MRILLCRALAAAAAAAVLLAACDNAPAPVESATATAPAPTAAPAARPAGGRQAAAVVDAQGFGQSMNAATLEIPAGWQVQGGVNWQRADPCVSNQLLINWVAQSADGGQAFEVMRPFSWQVQGRSIPMNPCPVLPFASARDFLQAVVQQRRPGARVLDYRDRPDLRAQAEAQPQPPAGMTRQVDAGELHIAYASPAGAEVQERLFTSVTFTQVQNSVMGGAGTTFAQRRVGGPPDAALGNAIAASMKIDPQWLALMREAGQRAEQQVSGAQRQQIEQWHAREMARINAQGAADRAAIRSQTQHDLARIQSQTYANTQATNDRMHRRNLEGIGEYNTYRDNAGNTVQGSIHGPERVLRNADGSVTRTNDPYYNPPGSQQMQRVP